MFHLVYGDKINQGGKMSETISNNTGEYSLNTDSDGPWGEAYQKGVPSFNPEQKQEIQAVDDTELVQEMIKRNSDERENADTDVPARIQERERILTDALNEQSAGSKELRGKPIEEILQAKIDDVSEQAGKIYRGILSIEQVTNSPNSITERLEAQYEELDAEGKALREVLAWTEYSRKKSQHSETLEQENN